MISHEHQCIFLHIPKCAGTSIEKALGHFDDYEGRGGQDHRTLRMVEEPWLSHHVFRSKDNLLEAWRRLRFRADRQVNPRNGRTLTKEQYASYFKFTFVRNPWDRVHSWYRNVMRDERHRGNYGISDSISMKEFIRRFVGHDLLLPQTHWIKNWKGEIPLDFIGRFENLQDDFAEVCRLMGLPGISLPHEVKGSGGDPREEYDEESIRLVDDAYKESIELFGYTFE